MPARSDPYRPAAATAPELSAGAVVLHPASSRVLLLHEVAEERWSLPKGHVDEGESLAATTRREVREETALAPIDLGPELGEVRYRFYDRTKGHNVHKTVVYFLARARATRARLEPLFDRYAWVAVTAALRDVRFESDRQVLRAARRALRAGLAPPRRRQRT